MAKQHAGRELWDRMQAFAEVDDGPPEYECGAWTLRKLFFLCQYLATTTNAIVGSPKFSSVNYVDLFASNGICVVVGEDGRRRRYAGSALLAAGCKKPFQNIFLVEQEPKNAAKLKERIAHLKSRSNVEVHTADANLFVKKLADLIPDNSLTVAFIDPFSLGIHYDAVQALAQARPLDLIILFADAMDISRNVDQYYVPRRSNKLDLFLGLNSNWRPEWGNLTDRSGAKCNRFFAEIYLRQLAKLDYRHSTIKSIASDTGQQLYSLVYASKNPLGLKFWNIAANEDLGGTKNLWSPS